MNLCIQVFKYIYQHLLTLYLAIASSSSLISCCVIFSFCVLLVNAAAVAPLFKKIEMLRELIASTFYILIYIGISIF